MTNDTMSAEEIVRGRIDAIKARCEAATPGPWIWEVCEEGYDTIEAERLINVIGLSDDYPGYAECGEHLIMELSKQDAAFIAHTREDVPYLLGLIESQAAEIASREQASIDEHNELHQWRDRAKAAETQLAEVTQIALDVTGKYETSIRMHGLTTELLNASQQETRAAVEDMKHGDNCEVCKHNVEQPECDCECLDCKLDCVCRDCRDESLWQWRGPQEESFISRTIDGAETAVILRRGHQEAGEGER